MMTFDVFPSSYYMQQTTPASLRQVVKMTARHYLSSMGSKQLQSSDLYDLFLAEMEQALFEEVLNFTGGNESRAARILGISRGTLRQRREAFGHYSEELSEKDNKEGNE